MKIEVTQDDIDRGEARDCGRCPVATALKRVLDIEDVDVIGGCYLSGKYYDLSSEVRKFVTAFDSGQPVQPFTFELDLTPS